MKKYFFLSQKIVHRSPVYIYLIRKIAPPLTNYPCCAPESNKMFLQFLTKFPVIQSNLTQHITYLVTETNRGHTIHCILYTRNSRRFAPFFLAIEGASRPSPKLIVNMFSLCTSYIVRQNKNNSRIFKILKNLMTIEF